MFSNAIYFIDYDAMELEYRKKAYLNAIGLPYPEVRKEIHEKLTIILCPLKWNDYQFAHLRNIQYMRAFQDDVPMIMVLYCFEKKNIQGLFLDSIISRQSKGIYEDYLLEQNH